MMLNLHTQCGIDRCQKNFTEIAHMTGVDPTKSTYVPCRIQSKVFVEALYNVILDQDELQNVDFWWEDWGVDLGGKDTPWKVDCEKDHCQRCLNDTYPRPQLWSAYVKAHPYGRRGDRALQLQIYGGLGH